MILASSRHFAGEPTILASILTNPGKLPIIEAVFTTCSWWETPGIRTSWWNREWSPARLPDDDRIRLRKTRFCVCVLGESQSHIHPSTCLYCTSVRVRRKISLPVVAYTQLGGLATPPSLVFAGSVQLWRSDDAGMGRHIFLLMSVNPSQAKASGRATLPGFWSVAKWTSLRWGRLGPHLFCEGDSCATSFKRTSMYVSMSSLYVQMILLRWER
jgi:hypothetical protein